MSRHRQIKGTYFVLQNIKQVHGTVKNVVTTDRRRKPSAAPSLFDKDFYLLYIDENNDPHGALTTVMLDNNIIPYASLTGENSIAEKRVIIGSRHAIVIDEPGRRAINGTFFALRHITDQIHGVVIEVVAKERRQSSPSPTLFDKGLYLIYINEQKNDDGLEIRQSITVVMDRDINPLSSITGENSIEGKVVVLERNEITIIG